MSVLELLLVESLYLPCNQYSCKVTFLVPDSAELVLQDSSHQLPFHEFSLCVCVCVCCLLGGISPVLTTVTSLSMSACVHCLSFFPALLEVVWEDCAGARDSVKVPSVQYSLILHDTCFSWDQGLRYTTIL